VRSSDPWTHPRALLTLALVPVATALCLFLGYGNWGVSPLDPVFRMTFDRVPWVRMSVVMTLVTSIAAVAGANRRSNRAILGSSVTYAVVVIPLLFFLLHPGPSAIGRPYGDSAVYGILIGLIAVHAVGFHHIRRAVEEAEAVRRDAA
jgi:hypothetical protein